MAFGQLTHRESLSDTVLCLKLNEEKLYHLGIGKSIHKTTLSRANENRDWRIFQDFSLLLIQQAQDLYKNENQLGFEFDYKVVALDSTFIDLCLNVFSWAKFRRAKGAIKLHTMLDLKTSIPCFIHITDGSVHDINFWDMIKIESDGFYVVDRGYLDFGRLFILHQANAFFVTRARKKFQYVLLKSNKVNKNDGILNDQVIKLKNHVVYQKYPLKLRRIKYYDQESGKTLVFLTNNFDLKALEIAALYKNRWKIELFFKWIKQHLKVKTFWGYSSNAVKIQIWTAISVYVLVAIVKKKLNLSQSMYEMLQILSINIFDKVPLNELFMLKKYQDVKEQNYNQLKLFDL
jgi:hypothetical protein